MTQGGRRFKKHDYHKKKYSNPLFNNKKTVSFSFVKLLAKINFKSTFVFFIVFILIVGAIWFFTFSNYFRIQNISLTIPSKYSQAEINQLVWQEADGKALFFSKHNILFFNTENIRNLINNRYTVSNLKVVKKLPNKILISFEDKVYKILWQEANLNYLISPEDGLAKSIDTNLIKVDGLPTIVNTGQIKIVDNKLTDTKLVTFIFTANMQLAKNSKFKIENFRVGDDIGLIEVKFKDGPIVKLSTEENLDKQLEKLYNIINLKLKDDFKNKSYIDVRYGDTVYIK
ncbi:MAG: hypothetical protein WCG01_02810 [bacterium]